MLVYSFSIEWADSIEEQVSGYCRERFLGCCDQATSPSMGLSRENVVVSFNRVFKSVFVLTLACGAAGFLLACIDAAFPVPHAQQLISLFADGFKMGFAGILGLLGGRALNMRRRQ
jgi:hypothetical protein